MKAILIFILSFLGMNILAFLPFWIVGLLSKIESSKKAFFDDSPYFLLKKLIYYRTSDDPFRSIFELQLLTCLLLISSSYLWLFKSLFMALILIAFVYITYTSVIIKIFKKTPLFVSDIDFVKTGLMAYKKKVPVILLSLILLLIGVFFTSKFLTETLLNAFKEIERPWILIPLFVTMMLLSVLSIKKNRMNVYHNFVNYSVILHIAFNLKRSKALIRSLRNLKYNSPYDYVNTLKLKKQPNIIIIFLESYGSFALSNDSTGKLFKEQLENMENTLGSKGYKIVSTLSESPTFSGGSWLSHSSVFFGAQVTEIAAHELIFNQTEFVSKLEALPKFLKRNGYTTTVTSTLSYHENEVDWEKIKNAYPFDHLMLVDEFDYSGKTVPIFGNRYTIPDEYTLNYAYENLKEKGPFLLTVNTTNSHYSFISPIQTQQDWKDYNIASFELTNGQKKNNLNNYFSAIEYQFEYIQNFLLKNQDEDAITILIGDHQPPLITPKDIDKSTPIHIISKNEDFISAFKNFDYITGFIPRSQTQKHESFFSKFLSAFNNAYGEQPELKLPIFEEGIHLY